MTSDRAFFQALKNSHLNKSIVADYVSPGDLSVPQTNAKPVHLVCSSPAAHFSINTSHTLGIRTVTNPNARGP